MDNEQLLIFLEKDIRNLFEETDFKHWYRKWQNENSKVIEKINKNNICVAIAYPSDANFRDSSNSYFSLSGSAKDYVGTAISNPKWKSKMNIIYDSISE